jgi:homoserine O-acetyltransferase
LGKSALSEVFLMPRHGRIVYKTFGALNAARDNAVLVPTYFTGTDASYLPLIGAGQPLDPAQLFIIIPNMLGNGVSDSPSTNAVYVPASIADNVHAQAALLDTLGVQRLRLAYGWSMGAMQSLWWAALYPDRVRAVLAVCGTASCWDLNYVFLEGQKAALQAGPAAFGRAYAGWAYSAAFFRAGLWRNMGFESLEDFLTFWEDDHLTYDPRDLSAMVHSWQTAHMKPELFEAITAHVVMMPCNTDAYFTETETRMEAAMIAHATVETLHSPYGHCAGAPARFATENDAIAKWMARCLQNDR